MVFERMIASALFSCSPGIDVVLSVFEESVLFVSAGSSRLLPPHPTRCPMRSKKSKKRHSTTAAHSPHDAEGDRAHSRFEIQIHPSDIQSGVKYLFLSRGQLAAVAAGILAYLVGVGYAVTIGPSVIGGMLSQHEYQAQLVTGGQLNERLQALDHQLEQLSGFGDTLQLKMNKIYLAYGLDHETSIGQGGYPAVPRDLPETSLDEQLQKTAALDAQLRQQAAVLDAFIREIEEFERDHRDQVTTTPSISPLRSDTFVLTSPFGNRVNPFTKASDFHGGIDLAANTGTPIYAAADGRVNFASRYSVRQSVGWWRYGNLVTIKHSDRFITLYGHLDEIKVKAGSMVKQGDVIGTVGSTGWSTNPHLHYEVRREDETGDFRPVDPRVYILDHRWRDEERLLIRARSAPSLQDYEPLPNRIRR